MDSKYKIVIIVLLIMNLAMCNSTKGVYKNVTIVECEYPRFRAGYISTWIKITIEQGKGKRDRVYYPHIGDKNFPIPGEKYDLYYKIEDIEGFVGKDDNQKIKNAKIVEKYTKKN